MLFNGVHVTEYNDHRPCLRLTIIISNGLLLSAADERENRRQSPSHPPHHVLACLEHTLSVSLTVDMPTVLMSLHYSETYAADSVTADESSRLGYRRRLRDV